MAVNKTTFTQQNVSTFITHLESDLKQADCLLLIDIMQKVSGEAAQMFGTNIIGFGKYQYTYASGHQGVAPLIGFSPRKSAFSLYVYTGLAEHAYLLEHLGKYTMGKACIYIKKVSDINLEVLQQLLVTTISYLTKTYTRIA